MFIALALAVFSILTLSLQKTYAQMPVSELRRRARAGDELADGLYRAASYGASLRAVLWLLIGITNASFFVYVAQHTSGLTAFLCSVLLIWLGMVWLPAREVTSVGNSVAKLLAPPLAWLLNYLHPIIDRLVGFIRKIFPIRVHTGLYDKSDLVDLLDRQQVQSDNRILQAELEMARNALIVGDKLVGDVLTPRRMVKMVSEDDVIGPVLMTELHKSGHSRFPVYAGKKDNIVGTLYMRDLVNVKSGGSVKRLVHADTSYIHEEQSLVEALQAILKTHHHLFIVVNSFEEYVGIVTIEDVLEQVVGSPIVDEFDRYDDIRAVAAVKAAKEHNDHLDQENIVSEPPEVIE